ncbi:MAG TPA: DUF6544 family protein [Gemmatimonadales bacterium]|nr:DUF6544 family protein [Gemmatimonadales bacterium]
MRSWNRWHRPGLAAAGITAAGAALALVAGSRRWQRTTEALVRDLDDGATTALDSVAFERLGELPAPVQRYFRLVLRDGQPRIAAAEVRQRGAFRSREGGDPETGWSPFTAVQRFTAVPPGFVWDARIRMAPLVTVRARDGYVRNRASMRGEVAALVPVVNAADGPELRAGALQRWLAEAVWLPTALFPGAGVSWAPMDDTHARATVTDGRTAVSLEFEFSGEGEIVALRTPARLRAGKDGRYLPAPWGGRYRRYEEHAGMRLPAEAEVYWVLDGREEPYYRGRNESVAYTFATKGAVP